MASEDASIRRLRRLMGKQRFDEEASKGEVIQKRNATQRVDGEASQRKAQQEAQLAPKTTQLGTGSSPREKAKESVPKASDTGSQPNQMKGRKKLMRAREKCSPYSDTEYETDSEDGMTPDQEGLPNMAFCPVIAVSKYPYKYLGANKDLSERVADAHFNNGQFWDRRWSIFYIHPPDAVSQSPIFFVPAKEVQALFNECKKAVQVPILFPTGGASAGFQVTFSANEPRPRYLGISNSREDFNDMSVRTPPALDGVRGAWSQGSGNDRSFKAWQTKLEDAMQASKQKKKNQKGNAQQRRIASKQQWYRQLRRSQRYLGLRAPNDKEAKGATANNLDEAAALQLANEMDDPEYPPDLNISKPPQFGFDQDVVFLSIDIEAHETIQTMITEVGLSTLDTRDLKGVAPGKFAENWRPLIKYRHFRISEFRTHVNSRFVSGCPDRFEKDFGVSEFVPLADVNRVIALSCKPPFPMDAAERAAVEGALDHGDGEGGEPRKIVLVGHNFDSDVDYLRRAGFQVLKLAGLVEVLDTSMIYRALARENNPISLMGLLSTCQIAGWNLHNAGNDAGYTLQALLAMAVDHLVNPEYRLTEEQHVQRRETAMKLAAERENSDFQEWMLADQSSPTMASAEWGGSA